MIAPMTDDAPRRRGGQPGNRNARKHGRYGVEGLARRAELARRRAESRALLVELADALKDWRRRPQALRAARAGLDAAERSPGEGAVPRGTKDSRDEPTSGEEEGEGPGGPSFSTERMNPRDERPVSRVRDRRRPAVQPRALLSPRPLARTADMRRLAPLSACALAAAIALTLPAAALTPEQQGIWDKVTAYWNGVPTAKGAFVQTDSNGGQASGTFYLRKPGRFRFEYAPPAAQLVIADGYTVAVEDKKLETQDRYPLVETPLSILVDDRIELTDEIQLIDVQTRPGEAFVYLRSTEEDAQGDLVIAFAWPEMALKYWQVTDAAGTKVTVQVSGVETGVQIDPKFFFIEGTSRPEDEER